MTDEEIEKEFRETLIAEFKGDEAMENPRYAIVVRSYMFRQFRIQLTDATKQDAFAPRGYGPIVRELCTYSPSTAEGTIMALRAAKDPAALCREWADEFICEEKEEGRIRLDEPAGSRIGVAER